MPSTSSKIYGRRKEFSCHKVCRIRLYCPFLDSVCLCSLLALFHTFFSPSFVAGFVLQQNGVCLSMVSHLWVLFGSFRVVFRLMIPWSILLFASAFLCRFTLPFPVASFSSVSHSLALGLPISLKPLLCAFNGCNRSLLFFSSTHSFGCSLCVQKVCD